MSTILTSLDFTDTNIKNSVQLSGTDWSVVTNPGLSATSASDNVYLYKTDRYYESLLRARSIDADDVNLADPVTFEVKEVMVYWCGVQVLNDLIDDSKTPFEGDVVLEDKFEKKLRNYERRLSLSLSQLDRNAFYDSSVESYEDISTDITSIGTIGRS